MPIIRSVDPSVFDRKPLASRAAPELDPELAYMVKKLARIKDPSLVYEVALDKGEKASTVRTRLLRAAKIADIEVAVRKSPKGWYVGMMTPARRSKAGRRPEAA